MAQTGGDVARPSLGELDWSPEARSASLSKVYAHADGLALSAERWYADKRRRKRIGGVCLRVGAIVLGAVAAILPIIAQIGLGADGRPSIEPAWASVALGAAAALVALDLYFGFSSGWMRFMSTELQLTRLRHEFEYDWEAARARGSTVEELLELARSFVIAVDAELEHETGAWVSEFRSNLAATERGLSKSSESH